MSAKRHILPVFVPHLGCPNDCVFCNQRRVSGQSAPATAETVRDILERADSDCGYELAFYGGSFTAIPAEEQEALLGSALPFLRSNILSCLRISTRPDAINESVLDRLAHYGVTTIEIGAQSMRDSVLVASGRGHTAQDVRNASALIKSHGFSLILQMMTGLPGDDDEGSIFSAKELIKLEPDGVRVYPTVIIRDTMLYQLWEQGAYVEHTVEDAVRVGAEIIPLFEAAEILVIRFGLNPTEELSGGDAIAGAYHPALGELVYSRVMQSRAREILQGTPPGSRVELGVNTRDMSRMVGLRRENICALTDEFELESLKICANDNKRGEITLISVAKDQK